MFHVRYWRGKREKEETVDHYNYSGNAIKFRKRGFLSKCVKLSDPVFGWLYWPWLHVLLQLEVPARLSCESNFSTTL